MPECKLKIPETTPSPKTRRCGQLQKWLTNGRFTSDSRPVPARMLR